MSNLLLPMVFILVLAVALLITYVRKHGWKGDKQEWDK